MTDTLPPLTSAELSDLKAKAKAATPGEWPLAIRGEELPFFVVNRFKRDTTLEDEFKSGPSRMDGPAARDAVYVSAANPETILRLIAMIERRDAALNKIALAGENGLPPDYNSWLQFHERIARMAREALAAGEPPK